MATPPITRETITGEAGAIEIAAILPTESVARAVAVIAHPHPLFGGTMDNKVVTTLARAMFDAGAAAYRFNFRGVGGSAGTHDEGQGETRDMEAVIAHAMARHPGLPLWLAGFSFGGAVTLAVSEKVLASEMILVAPAFKRLANWANNSEGGRPPASTLVIHGEADETVPLADSLAWARPRDIPVLVIAGADHFFHQKLHIIRRIVGRLVVAPPSRD